MLHHPQQEAPSGGGGQAPLACRAAGGGAGLPKAGREGGGICGVCPAGDRLGPRDGGQLPVLPVGSGGVQGKGLRAGADGVLPGGRRSEGEVGRLHAGRPEAEGLALRPELWKKYGFQVVDTAAGGYELLVLSFDGTAPRFTEAARRGTIPEQELTIDYGMQCPYIHASVEQVKRFCGERGAPVTLIPVDSLHRAKELPGVFNNWAVFYRGRLETVNLLDEAGLKQLLSK